MQSVILWTESVECVWLVKHGVCLFFFFIASSFSQHSTHWNETSSSKKRNCILRMNANGVYRPSPFAKPFQCTDGLSLSRFCFLGTHIIRGQRRSERESKQFSFVKKLLEVNLGGEIVRLRETKSLRVFAWKWCYTWAENPGKKG